MQQPFGCDRIKLVEEQNTRLRRTGSLEQLSHLHVKKSTGTDSIDNKLRTDCSLAPMYLFSSSGPFTLIKFSPHSFATADASKVFPQPGKPYKSKL